jgi:aminopeptidase N
MIKFLSTRSKRLPIRAVLLGLAALLPALLSVSLARADEPYARSRSYDLQHSKIALRFDIENKKVIGDVTHSLSILKDATSKISFDSVGLTIQSVTVNKSAAKFETTDSRLIVSLLAPAKAGDKLEIEIRYEGKPRKGLYFILPDKDYPDRPIQIWSQGESEDTRYYIPIYDYPNDRLTTETILTVPASWLTISNGKLIGVTDAPKDMKTWTWRESLPSSTYLITVVAGQLDELKDSWRGMPVPYYAPKGRGDHLKVNYSHTPAMLKLFSEKFGVDYPWEKYAQVMVDDFVAGGMENSSATTNTSSSLVNPKLAPEYVTGQDDLISHELMHQWFGDLVTCKDWGNIWLNEGFATFGETLWIEFKFGKDEADYNRWEASREWFAQNELFKKPIVRHDFSVESDSDEFDGNAYTKGGWVLDMLRHQLGEDAYFRGMKHYLDVNRGKNVVTADLTKAIEEATHTNVDLFFDQWIYGAGAPKFDLAYSYDAEKHKVSLTVKQTQTREGRVGLFTVPVEVEITTASGVMLYPITVSEESQSFTFPSDSAPLMVLFDKGDHILKTAEFHKEKKEWLYQLKHAGELSDRADAVVALAKLKGDAEIVPALGDTLRADKTWGVRAVAADALGRIGGEAAGKQLLEALDKKDEPWVRNRIVNALGNFKDNPAVAAKLDSIAREDSFYRSRASALQALGRIKAPVAFATLSTAISSDSPDDILRDAALRAFGSLGDEKAVPLLLEWSALGKPLDSRTAAIYSLARLQKDNKELTSKIASYLPEQHHSVRLATIRALGERGDPSAIPALEALLKSDDLSIEVAPVIKSQIERLQHPSDRNPNRRRNPDEVVDESAAAQPAKGADPRMDKLELLIKEMNDRLKTIESRLPPPKQ